MSRECGLPHFDDAPIRRVLGDLLAVSGWIASAVWIGAMVFGVWMGVKVGEFDKDGVIGWCCFVAKLGQKCILIRSILLSIFA